MFGNMYPYGYAAAGQMGQPTYTPQFNSYTPQTQQPVGTELVSVQTISQVEQIGLQPGQRKMVMVQNEPVIAARSADNMGLVTTEYYRLEKFVPGAQAPAQMDNYVTRQEFNAFVESLKAPSNKEAAE